MQSAYSVQRYTCLHLFFDPRAIGAFTLLLFFQCEIERRSFTAVPSALPLRVGVYGLLSASSTKSAFRNYPSLLLKKDASTSEKLLSPLLNDIGSHQLSAAKVDVAPLPSAVPYGLPKDLRDYLLTSTIADSQPRRKISLLGSTGSIGTQTLDILESSPEHFELVGIAAGGNVKKLAEQVKKFSPKIVAIREESKEKALNDLLADMGSKKPIIVSGEKGVVDVATYEDAETVVTGIVGYAGLLPTIRAIESGKHIALANKETLVAAGPVILPLLKKHNTKMTPADSEHSALFQCLQGSTYQSISKLILTASGGPFRNWGANELKNVKLSDALKHPNYAMGAKITIDSATLMNKALLFWMTLIESDDVSILLNVHGLEVIEAHNLFGVDYDHIDVVVHPQSIIHSMVEYQDSSVLAQLGWPDMRLPLLYAMSWPKRMRTSYSSLNLIKVGSLTFQEPDFKKYPCLALAYSAGRASGTMPAALNAANEQAVQMFRDGHIHFLEIPRICEMVMEAHLPKHKTSGISLEDIVETDLLGRQVASQYKSTMLD